LEIQTSQSARLIGFTVVLFTLSQIVQLSNQNPISRAFSSLLKNVYVTVPDSLVVIGSLLALLLLFLIFFVLSLFIIRSIFRYAVYGRIISILMHLSETDVQKQQEQQKQESGKKTLQETMSEIVKVESLNKKLYGIIPSEYFLAKLRISLCWA
jgi:hypothetical protein